MFHLQSTYLLKLAVRLTLQFVSLSPFNVHLGQTRSLGLKVWGRGTNRFSGVSTSVFTILFDKNFLGKTKFGRIAPECPPWLQI